MKTYEMSVVLLVVLGLATSTSLGSDKCTTAPQECPENEFWNECGSSCPRTCEVPVRDPNKSCLAVCVIGCDCNPRYLRNKEGKCVPEETCIKCPKGQHWNKCASACPATCEDPEPSRPCIEICVSKCDCDKGLLWENSTNSCVEPCDCPTEPTTTTPTCPENEIWSSISPCNPTCERPYFQHTCVFSCRIGCDCIPGYLRNKYGKCVPEKDCIKCSKHQHWNPCASACPKTCDEPHPGPCTKQCVRRCDCDDGFLWDNSTESCVKPCRCPETTTLPTTTTPVCPENEIWTNCGSVCENNCEYPNGNPKLFCPALCVPKCVCDIGYLRNKKGKCVPKGTCIKCPKNEVWNDCASACPKTCENREPGPCILMCQQRCDCNKGLLRNKNGTCVKEKDFKCLRNQRWNQCASACPKTCEKPNPVPCTKQCVARCDCEDGFLWDNSTKSCAEPRNCSPNTTHPVCPKNEFWNTCASSCGKSSEYPNGNPDVVCAAVCVAKCDCNAGYLRDKKGKCVPQATCVKCPKNEKWNDCASACPKTCKNREPGPCILVCRQRCDCLKGLIRHTNGTCVKEEYC